MSCRGMLLLLLAILLFCVHSSPSSKLKEAHDLFMPIIHQDSGGILTIQMSDFILHLRNQNLPPHFTNTYFNEAGKTVETNISNCFFDGIVEGYPNWTVILSACHGLHGHFGDKKHHYHIKPLDQNNNSIHQLHILYSGSAGYIELLNLTSQDSTSLCDLSSEQTQHMRFEEMREGLEAHKDSDTSGHQRIVELVLVNDHSQYLSYDKELFLVILRDIEIVNYINQLYDGFNVSITLVGTVTWTIENRIPVPADKDPVELLVGFRDYFHLISGTIDSALLISGLNFKGNIVGLAYKGAMCFGSYSIGIVQDGRGGVNYVGGTAAHELGHVLGMSHDDFEGRVCDCDDPTGKCIMASISSSTPPTVWSNCSFQDMEDNFIAYPATQVCLFNHPSGDVMSVTDNNRDGSAANSQSLLTLIGLSTISMFIILLL